MLTRLFSLNKCKGQKPKLPTVEQWAKHNSRKTSPDGMIAAVIVESLATHWEDWVATDLREAGPERYSSPSLSPKIENKKKKIVVCFGVRRFKREHYYANWQSEGTTVNGVAIELKASRYITAGYERIAKQQKALQESAARAKAAMEANEAKWDLAEKLLGFKRVNGALVPVKTAEEKTA